MGKKLNYILIFCRRGHGFHCSKKHICPFAKRSIIWAYLRYGPASTRITYSSAWIPGAFSGSIRLSEFPEKPML
jgi:hypothetical protein